MTEKIEMKTDKDIGIHCPYLIIKRYHSETGSVPLGFDYYPFRCSINNKGCVGRRSYEERGVHDDETYFRYHHELTKDCSILRLIEIDCVDLSKLNSRLKSDKETEERQRKTIREEIERKRRVEYEIGEKERRTKRKVELARIIKDSKNELKKLS